MNLNKGCIEIIPPAVPHYSKHGRMNLNKGCIEIHERADRERRLHDEP